MISTFALAEIREFPQLFPQVWKTLVRDQRLHGLPWLEFDFEKEADSNTLLAD
jgi:hypothetical protein